MILLRSFLSGHIRIKRTLEYYDAGIGPRVPFGGGFGPTVSANFAVDLGDFTTLSSTSTMPPGGSISRAGNAMLYDSTGKLTYAPNNVALYSQDWTNWTADGANVTSTNNTAPDNSATATLLTAASGNYGRYRLTTFTVGTAYIFSVYVKQGPNSPPTTIRTDVTNQAQGPTFNFSTLSYSGGPGSSNFTVTDAGNGWYRLSFKITATVAGIGPGIVMSGGVVGSTLYVWGQMAEAVTYQTTPSAYTSINTTTTSAYYGPRFDYDPVTLQPRGLLVEGTRTNYFKYSQDFNNTGGWAKTGINVAAPSVSSSTTLSPDGTANANQVSFAATNFAFDQSNLLQQLGTIATVGETWTYSIWMRTNSGTATVYLSINDGVYATRACSVTTTWQRFSISKIVTANTFLDVTIGPNNAPGSGQPTSQPSATVLLYGAQAEKGAFATSYIPTVASSVARAAETFSLTGYANRLVEAYYIDEETGANYSGNSALSTGTVTISPPTFGWVTSLRGYQNAYAGSISSPSWLSFSGTTGTTAGNRTYYDSTGTLTWAPANLLNRSQEFNNSYWNKLNGASITPDTTDTLAPDGTQTADRINGTASGYTQYVEIQSPSGAAISAETGYTYTHSVYLKAGTISNVRFLVYNTTSGVNSYGDFNLSAVTAVAAGSIGPTRTVNIVDAGNGWRRCSLTTCLNSSVVGQILNVVLYADNGNYYAWGIQTERVTYQTAPSAYIPTTLAAVYGPRYDYDPSTVPATPRGLLIEESRANEFRNSQNFTTLGGGNVLTPVLASGIAPDGTNTANKLTEDTTASTSHFLYYGAATFTGTYTASIFAKYNGRRYVWLSLDTSATGFYFDIQNGTSPVAFGSAGATAAMSYVGNGWYRCSVTQTITAKYFYFGLSASTSSYVYSGDGVSGALLWGGQIEAGAFATSYIPNSLTTGSVTRAADIAQWTSAAQFSYFNAAAGTFGAQIIRNSSGGNNGVFEVPISAGFNDLIFGDANTDYRYGSGSNVDTVTGTASTSARVMVGYTASNFTKSLVVNNGTVFTGTAGGAPTYTGGNLKIGYSSTANAYLNGHLQSFAYYNQRLPNAILKQKSQVNAPY